jgi:hypothetical protein
MLDVRPIRGEQWFRGRCDPSAGRSDRHPLEEFPQTAALFRWKNHEFREIERAVANDVAG